MAYPWGLLPESFQETCFRGFPNLPSTVTFSANRGFSTNFTRGPVPTVGITLSSSCLDVELSLVLCNG